MYSNSGRPNWLRSHRFSKGALELCSQGPRGALGASKPLTRALKSLELPLNASSLPNFPGSTLNFGALTRHERSWMTHFAHRNELLLRWGEVQSGGLWLILSGSVHVEALLELAECRFELFHVERLAAGDVFGAGGVSRFSFRVTSRLLSFQRLADKELEQRALEREELWEQRVREHLESYEEPELKLPFRDLEGWASGPVLERERARVSCFPTGFLHLKLQEELRGAYQIPPELLMVCHPDLRAYSAKRRDPPQPITVERKA